MMSSAKPRRTKERASVTIIAGYRPIATNAPTMAPKLPPSASRPPKIPSVWFEFGIAADLSGAAAVAALRSGSMRPRQGERLCGLVCGAGSEGV
jgi:hypothetical protein